MLLLPCVFLANRALGQNLDVLKVQSHNEFIAPAAVSAHGILGQAISGSENGRLLILLIGIMERSLTSSARNPEIKMKKTTGTASMVENGFIPRRLQLIEVTVKS